MNENIERIRARVIEYPVLAWVGQGTCDRGHEVTWLFDGRVGYAYGFATDCRMVRGDSVTEVRVECLQPVNEIGEPCDGVLVIDRFDQPRREPDMLELLARCGQVVS